MLSGFELGGNQSLIGEVVVGDGGIHGPADILLAEFALLASHALAVQTCPDIKTRGTT